MTILRITFKDIFLSSLLLLLSLQTHALECQEKSTYYRCDFTVTSKSLGHNEIPIFIYLPIAALHNNSNMNSILFLHGRGYARNVGSIDSMLEHLNIDQLLAKQENQNLAFVAPQDNILQSDSKEIGQDYWIGAGNRDWPSFLSSELPGALETVSQALKVQFKLETAMGISMGAHGALMLGQLYPERYRAVIALSPIFRSRVDELSDSDRDVFLKSGEPMLEEYNFGTKLIRDNAALADRTFIEISENDFGLDTENFPSSTRAWKCLFKLNNNLKAEQSPNNNHIKISDDPRGHSHEYWKEAFPRAIEWQQLSH